MKVSVFHYIRSILQSNLQKRRNVVQTRNVHLCLEGETSLLLLLLLAVIMVVLTANTSSTSACITTDVSILTCTQSDELTLMSFPCSFLQVPKGATFDSKKW